MFEGSNPSNKWETWSTFPKRFEELLWKKGADDVERGEHRGKALRRP
jgi:hypothetical protein